MCQRQTTHTQKSFLSPDTTNKADNIYIHSANELLLLLAPRENESGLLNRITIILHLVVHVDAREQLCHRRTRSRSMANILYLKAVAFGPTYH
jgi:hypothetical protein